MSMDVTMMLVSRQNTRNTMWAGVPQRALTISSTVWVVGAWGRGQGQEGGARARCARRCEKLRE